MTVMPQAVEVARPPAPAQTPAPIKAQDWIVLQLPRRIGWDNYAEIRETLCAGLRSCVQQRRTGLVVDLTGATLSDSSALVLLIRTATRAGLHHYPMRLVVPTLSVQLRQVLHTLGLAAALPLFPSVHCAVSDPSPSLPADPVVLQHALRALQDLRLADKEPGSLLVPPAEPEPDRSHGDQGLIITVTSPDARPLRLELGGTLTHGSMGHLGNVLTAFVDRSLHHLRIDSWPASGHAGVLPVLLGIRWRVAPGGGCLHLPAPPDWLRHLLHREGFRKTFSACAACALQLTEPRRRPPGAASAG
jgi:anti-anti-sigma regulatory factor